MLWPGSGPLRLAVALRPRSAQKSPASRSDRMNVLHLRHGRIAQLFNLAPMGGELPARFTP